MLVTTGNSNVRRPTLNGRYLPLAAHFGAISSQEAVRLRDELDAWKPELVRSVHNPTESRTLQEVVA
jgi:hypothetical protein